MIRVLVVDSQVLIRAGLIALLRAAAEFEVVGEAADGEQAVILAETCRPDVVLMDIQLPGISGIEATRQIFAAGGESSPRVLIFTVFDRDEYICSALRAGACGFLLKDTPPERLLAAIAVVAAGDMVFASSVARRLIEAYICRVVSVLDVPARLERLTCRERDVLRLVGRGLSNADIANHLLITEATVKTHLNRTMTKLGLSSRAQAVVLAYETGLVTPRNTQLSGIPWRAGINADLASAGQAAARACRGS